MNDDILNWDGVTFPTGNRDIDRFEEKNKVVSINVLKLMTALMIIRLSYIDALKIEMLNMKLIY